MTVRVDDTVPAGVTSITNTAAVEDDDANGPDPTPGNNTASDTDDLTAAPDLTVTKDDHLTVVEPGQTVTYTLVVRNVGNQDATGVTVTDVLPANTTLLIASRGRTALGGVVTWDLDPLAAGASETLDVTVRVNSAVPPGVASITNRVGVTHDRPDPTPLDNTAADTDALVTSSIRGFVYRDNSVDGLRQPAGSNPETGIAGVTVTLSVIGRGARFTLETKTAADGSYAFTGLTSGSYAITEIQPPSVFDAGPAGFYDGLDTPGTVGGLPRGTAGGAISDDVLVVLLGPGEGGVEYNFGENPPADPFGFVYQDLDVNGRRGPGEPGIPGVAVTASGTAFPGTPLERPLTPADVPGGSLTAFTDSNGRWGFSILPPGVYSFAEAQPGGFLDGAEEDADPNGPPAAVGNDRFDGVVLSPFPVRGPFNFGEVVEVSEPPGPLPPIDFFPPTAEDPSKRGLLGSTRPPPTPPALGTAPNFAAFGAPAARAVEFAAVAQDAGGGWVRVFDFTAGNERFRFRPFGDFAGGVRVAVADVTRDGIPDVIAVPGPGGGPVVAVFDGNTGAPVTRLMAFEPTFRGGLFVTAADFNGDTVPDVVVTPDAGGGPVVRVFDGRTGGVLANFLALDETFRGGLRVAAGDVNADGVPDLLATAGGGGGPRVAGYDGRTLSAAAPARLFGDFFAFAPELRSGFWMAAGDVDGDGDAEVVVGAGDGGAARVAVYSGRALATGAGPVTLSSFFAGDPTARSGARVAAADLDADGRPELLAAAGPGTWPVVAAFDPVTGAERDAFYAFPTDFRGGLFVG